MKRSLRYAARSDRGLVRSNNQDSVYAGPRLLAIADGMGGHAAGEVASKIVIGALAHLDDTKPGTDLLTTCRNAVHAGNNAIAELVRTQMDLTGMGTTLTAVLFDGPRLTLMHIGDSRAYLLRDNQFTQITRDDTFVQALIDAGRITAEEAATHPQRSYLVRALTGDDVEPTLTIREARAGDRLLLCSDGLSSVLAESALDETLRISDRNACADRLIELALQNGGPDNVTVIVADVVDIASSPTPPTPIIRGAAELTDHPFPLPVPAAPTTVTEQRVRISGNAIKAALAIALIVLLVTVAGFVSKWWTVPF